MKKTNLFYLITFLLTSLAYVACNRNTSLEPKVVLSERNRVGLQEAKTFFQANLKGSSKRTVNNLTKYPRWQEAYDGMTQNNLAKISIPLSFEDKQASYRLDKTERKNGKRKSDIVKLNLVVYRDENNDLQAFVLKMLATQDYLRANGYKVKDENFTGIKIAEDWEGNFIKGYTYENGVRTGKITKDYDPNQRGGGGDGSNCTYTVLDVYYRDCYDGDCSSWTYAGSDILGVSCVGLSGGDSELEETPDGGAGGVPAGDEEPDDALDDIDNRLQDSCLNNSLQKILSSNSTIKNKINQIFVGANKPNLIFVESQLDPLEGGETIYQGAGVLTAIHLNTSVLQYASQEYISETIVHEMIHAILYSEGMIPQNNQDHIQHYTMVNDPKYADMAVNALQSMHPTMPTRDALSIYFNGFGKFRRSSFQNLTVYEMALDRYGLTKADVDATAEKYKKRELGTKCKEEKK